MAAWTYGAHSERGLSHRRDGVISHDRYRVVIANGLLIIVVVDGAGSSALAGTGADIVVDALVEDLGIWSVGRKAVEYEGPLESGLRTEIDTAFLAAYRTAYGRLIDRARQQRVDPANYAAGGCAVLVAPRWLACRGIGDVSCFAGRDTTWQLVNRIYKSGTATAPLARNATRLLPYNSESELQQTAYAARHSGDLTLVCTDGALRAFATDTTPGQNVGTYQPLGAELNAAYATLGPMLQAGPAGRVAAADAWLAQFIGALAQGGERDDITIVTASSVTT